MKYSPEIVEKITELIARDSYTVKEVCQQVGISETTYFRWQDEKREFRESIKKAKNQLRDTIYHDAHNSILKLIRGYDYVIDARTKHVPPNVTAVIFALKQDGWVDKKEVGHSGEVGVKNIVGLILDESEEEDYQ